VEKCQAKTTCLDFSSSGPTYFSFSFSFTSVTCAVGPSVTTSSNDEFPSQNLVFWNLFEFSTPEIV
jgi:hypothetical protein